MTPSPDPAAFAAVAGAYERGRPEYPPALLDLLRPAGHVLDLAAGTGKLTRLLRTAPVRVTAVEPLAELRAFLDADDVLDARAESLPLPDASIDLVTVGDAWHWFDHERAADEVARVTRPGGRVALVWQEPDTALAPPWTDVLGRLLAPLYGDHPGFRDEQGRGPLSATIRHSTGCASTASRSRGARTTRPTSTTSAPPRSSPDCDPKNAHACSRGSPRSSPRARWRRRSPRGAG